MGVVAVAIIAGMIWLMMRIDRASSQRIERRREAWRAGGCVGPGPGSGCSGGGGCGGGGCGGGGEGRRRRLRRRRLRRRRLRRRR